MISRGQARTRSMTSLLPAWARRWTNRRSPRWVNGQPTSAKTSITEPPVVTAYFLLGSLTMSAVTMP